jgi:hypothetical protein
MAIDDIDRIPNESSEYCYSSRIMYVGKELWNSDWLDLFDSRRERRKSITYYNVIGTVPGLGCTGMVSLRWPWTSKIRTTRRGGLSAIRGTGSIIGSNAPKEYFNGVKFAVVQ